MLALKPVVRAAVTSCTVMAAGDCLCQAIQHRGAARKQIQHDWQRTGRFGLVGLTLHGPFFLAGFQLLDGYFGNTKTLSNAFLKTAVGQVTLFPVYVAAFFTYMGVLEGKTLPQCVEKVQSSMLPTMVTGTIFWPAANMVNFMYVPSTHRVAYVSLMGLVWNAYLSWVNTRTAGD